MRRYTALAGRIRTSLTDIQSAVERANLLSEKALRTSDDGYWDGVALNLQSFYTGVEHIFEDIGRTMETSLPAGSEWHMDLLVQMSGAIDGIRPAVISRTTRESLDEYRGFRHVVRNVYAFHLRADRLQALVMGLSSCFQAVNDELTAFADYLDKLK